jgi:transposase
MRDIELYRQILGLPEPWTVSRVELNVKEERVDVWVEWQGMPRWPCPECQAAVSLYDHADERTWRHLDTCQFLTYLHARPPRVQCPTHGVRQVRLPWAEPDSRFTALFERLAIDVLREGTVKGAARILRISWDAAWGIMERAVERGQLAKKRQVPTLIGVDEKAVAKGHTYVTIVCDLEHGTVEHVADEASQASLDTYFATLTDAERERIAAVAMDMSEAYIQSVKTNLPDGANKIVFDRYHIMLHMQKAVDRTWKQESGVLRAEGDESLTGTKPLWRYAAEHLPDKHVDRFVPLLQRPLLTARAWAIREDLRQTWSYRTEAKARRHLKRWYFWATHSRVKPVVKAARTVHNHLPNILTYFTHRITNATAEGLNSKIQTIKQMACGFRNREHYKTAIFFHCGGLNLYPATHSNA